jgi:hypothetical protein
MLRQGSNLLYDLGGLFMKRMLLVLFTLALAVVPLRAVDKKVIDSAIDKGVQSLRDRQQPDGTWKHEKMGATALAGLTLLECGAAKDDKAVVAAAAKVREAALRMTDTYSLSLSILFLDRLDNLDDTPLIESMLVRLLAGQRGGGWTYECPSTSEDEMRRLKGDSGTRELKGGRDLSKLPAKGKRKATDLAEEIQGQLKKLAVARPNNAMGCDHSNTQFATIALWVGRRYGMPAQGALLKIDQHYRANQFDNGGWGYTFRPPSGMGTMGPMFEPTASMTCAGLLGLAVGHGAALDIKKQKNPELESTDVSKDERIKAGFQALATAVGTPTGWSGEGTPAVDIPKASGKAFYFLWSLERVCVAFNVETLEKKNWYNWGAEILLVSQMPDGGWLGEYGTCSADTCFALLFLKRVNFARDLSSSLKSKGLGNSVLKAGGVGGASLKGEKVRLGPTDIGKPRTVVGKKPARGKPKTPEEAAARKLSDAVVSSAGEKRLSLLNELRDTKGGEYTEALAEVIGRLEGQPRKQARAALADRLTRMKVAVLREYLKDEDVEIRRAAALAAAQKDAKILAPDVIRLLSDPEPMVERAAYAALKAISGKDFGPRSGADRSEKAKAIAAWELWWKKEARE